MFSCTREYEHACGFSAKNKDAISSHLGKRRSSKLIFLSFLLSVIDSFPILEMQYRFSSSCVVTSFDDIARALTGPCQADFESE